MPTLYDAVLPRLAAHDIDQEIKECAIGAVALLVSYFADTAPLAAPSSALPDKVLPLLMGRLRNEITRMSALKALADLARSALKVDLRPVLVTHGRGGGGATTTGHCGGAGAGAWHDRVERDGHAVVADTLRLWLRGCPSWRERESEISSQEEVKKNI